MHPCLGVGDLLPIEIQGWGGGDRDDYGDGTLLPEELQDVLLDCGVGPERV